MIVERARVGAGLAPARVILTLLLLLGAGAAHAVAPAAPTGLQAGAGDLQVRLWWSSNTESDLMDYRIWYATYSSALSSKLFSGYTVLAEVTTKLDSAGIVNGTTYYYQVTARNLSSQESVGSNEASATPDVAKDTTPPVAASGLGVEYSTSQPPTTLNLSWIANTEADMKDYWILRSSFSGASTTKKTLATVAHPGTTRQDAGLVTQTTYYYQFMARDTALNASAASTEASAWPGDQTAPAAPSGLGVVNAGPGNILTLSWTANTETDLKDYGVYRATYTGAPVAPPTNVTRINAPGTTHQDRALTDGTTYYYRLTARDTSLNTSSASAEASAYPSDTVAPAPPTSLGVSAVTGGPGTSLNIFWAANTETDLKDYRIFRSTNGNVIVGSSWTATVAAIAQPGTTHQDTGLMAVVTYYYRITARDTRLNESSASGEVNLRPEDTVAPAAPGSTPTVADVPSDQGVALRLNWTAGTETDLREYRLYRSTTGNVTAGSSWTVTLATVLSPGTTHQDSGLITGTTYYFKFAARDTSGNQSGLSPEGSAVPLDNLPPATPVGLGISSTAGGANAGGRLSLTWTANTESDLKDYRMYRATWAGASPAPTPTQIASPGTTHQDGGLANGTTYYFRLTARDASLNESGYSAEASAAPADILAPGAPAGFAVSGSTNMAMLSWVANTESDLKDYRIRRATFVGGATGAPVLTTIAAPGTTHQDSGLTNDTTYYYQLTARDTTGNESPGSPEVSALPRMAPDTTPPSASVGLGVADVLGDQGGLLRLSWTANTEPDLKDYRVWRSTFTSATTQKTLAVTVFQPGTTHQDGGLTTGTTFYYRVTARDTNSNESGGSAEVSAFPVDNLPPAAPLGLGVADVAADQGGALRLSWIANTEGDLKDYGMYRATTVGGVDAAPTRIQQPGTTHQVAGLANGVTYYFRLTARDVNLNESGFSGEVSAIPYDNLAPGTPAAVGATDVPADQGFALRLSWNSNTESDMKDYSVYRATWAGASLSPTRRITFIAFPETTHQDGGLTNGATYYYLLTTRDVNLNESGGSGEVSAVPLDNLAPAAPMGLGVNDPGTGGILRLSWTANTEPDVRDYGLYRATFSMAPAVGGATRIGAPGTTHQDSGLANGTTYYYRLTARDVGLNEAGLSLEVSRVVGDITPPAMPGGVGVSNTAAGANAGGVLTLSWTANTEGDLKDYGVWRGTTAGGLKAAPTRVVMPGTTYQDSGLANGATVYYQLTARDVNLNDSPTSTEVSAYPADVVAPSAPTGLIAVAEAVGGLLDISWGPVTDADLKDYRVFRGTYSGGQEAAPTRTILVPGTTHQDRGLTNETTYFYRVTARDSSLNESDVSNQASALPRDIAPPAMPTGVRVTDPGTVSRLELTWNANTEVDLKEYRVYRSTAGGVNAAPTNNVATISAGNQALTDTGLAAGTTYYYRITARDFTGNESAGSAETSGMPSRSVSDVTIAQPNATTTLVVTPPTGEIRVELPPGTFPDPTSIAVMVATGSLPTDANPPPGVTLRTLPIAISITAGTRLQPARPVLLSVSYRDRDLPPDAKAERLKIARYDDNRRRWIVLDDSSVNTAKRQVRATTTHFSLFALVELAPPTDLSTVVVYPNPWQPGSKGAYDRAVVVVSGLVPQARVRIYTMTGRFIRELVPADAGGTTLWDGTNDSGEAVASGVYFVLADAPGQAVVRKRVAVER